MPAAFAKTGETGANLTIIHINDRHGRTDAEPYISQIAKDIKAGGGNVLILDAGDSLHGQTVTNLSKGETMVSIMNAVGYDAMVLGNHEFNYGVDRLLELSEMMDFPLLAANVKTADGDNLFQSCEIFPMNGITVGVFGLITPETLTKVDPRIVEGLIFESPVGVAENMVEALKKENCDIIIALTHLGIDEATLPSNRSEALATVSGIDVIIDGHSHTVLENGKTSGSALIAQTGAFGSHIGIVEITMASGKINKTAKLIEVPVANDETELIADEKIVSQIKQEEKKVEPITAVTVGHTPFKLEGDRTFVRAGETNLANVITDSILYATGADIAVYNGGGIRESIDAGDITMGQVLATLPFSNILVTIELNGADILKMLEHGVSQYPSLAGLFIQTAGIYFTFDPEAEPGSRVATAVMADGAQVDAEKTYTLATIEYLAAGGDGYDMLANGENLIYYGSDADALADYLMTQPIINAEPEGRVSVAEIIMTRAMLIAEIYKFAGSPAYNSEKIHFTDVIKHSDAIMWAAENGIVNGIGGGWFAPDKAVTREQMVTILYRYCQWDGIEVSAMGNANILSYKDAFEVSGYAMPAMQWACDAGLIDGKPGGYLDPQGSVTKAETMAALRSFKNIAASMLFLSAAA
jgi:5'-nucleotidase